MTNLTLVTGGTGRTGRRVADRLAALGRPVRIGSRTGHPPFDWDRPETWDPALAGVSAAYLAYAPDLAFPGAADTVGAFARRAAGAGVRRLVLLSGRGEDGALAGERAVAAAAGRAGAEWAVVRSAFTQNLTGSFLADMVAAGVLALPAGDVAEPFVDADDVAEVAVGLLTGAVPAGRVYEVTGPRSLTLAGLAAELAAAAGRPVAYLPVTPAQSAAGLVGAGLPAADAAALAELFGTVLDGRNAAPATGVADALGRPPRDLADWARAAYRR